METDTKAVNELPSLIAPPLLLPPRIYHSIKSQAKRISEYIANIFGIYWASLGVALFLFSFDCIKAGYIRFRRGCRRLCSLLRFQLNETLQSAQRFTCNSLAYLRCCTHLPLQCRCWLLLECLCQSRMYLAEGLVAMAYVDRDMTFARRQLLIGRS